MEKKLKPGFYRCMPDAKQPAKLMSMAGWQAPELTPLVGLDDTIKQLRANTASFAKTKMANHALLTGPRGCGKSTVMHGVAAEFKDQLVIVKLERQQLRLLPLLADTYQGKTEQMLLLCDELSFSADDSGILDAKVALDYIECAMPNMLLYATSNRRRMVPEVDADNFAHNEAGELQPAESAEEKVSFSDRFGLWLPVFEPEDSEYLKMVRSWFKHFNIKPTGGGSASEKDALNWARERGSKNGRIAKQYVLDWRVRNGQ